MPIAAFQALLDERARAVDSDAREAVEARIIDRYRARRAVLISDMSGFSRHTHQQGLLHTLGLIRHMQRLCGPLIKAAGGRLVKAEADNLFAAFETPQHAVEAAVAMQLACAADAAHRPAFDQVRISMGIGWGDMLDIDGHDLFGHEVNLASKLGEDVSEPGEILLTAAASARTRPLEGWRTDTRHFSLAGLDVAYFALVQTGESLSAGSFRP